jgi:hypothetical protein
MGRRKRTPEQQARRALIGELLSAANVQSMDDIQALFKETIAEFMEEKEALKIIMADTIDREIVESRKRGIINGYMEKPVSSTEIISLAERISGNIENINKM